jgi:elongation factor P
MAFGVTDLKKGRIFQIDNEPYKVIEYAQKVMGRGGSIVNVKIKSLLDGKVLSKTYKGNESIEPADVIVNKVQYLYNDTNMHYFMDQVTYEQYEIQSNTITDVIDFLKEGDAVQAQLFNGSLISIDLPKNIPLKVTYTEDVVKGDTSNSVQKEAELETGITVKVPSFIKNDDIISLDTESGTYRERISS